MEEQLISFETSKLVKEKGFKEKCYATYYDYPNMYKREYSHKKLIKRKLDKVKLHFNNSEIWIHPDEPRNEFFGCDPPPVHYIRYIDYESHLKNNNISKKDSVLKHWYSAPTQSQLQKWLREKHGIHVNISPLHLSNPVDWRQQAYSLEKGHYKGSKPAGFNYKTYEEALEEGLKQDLMLIE